MPNLALSGSCPSILSNSAASTNSVPSSANIIADGSLGPIDNIHALIFTNDSRYLILIVQPGKGPLLVKMWETVSGRCCTNLLINFQVVHYIKHEMKLTSQGTASSRDSLLTACSVFDQGPTLFVFCQKKHVAHVDLTQNSYKFHTLNRQFFGIHALDQYFPSLILLADDGIYTISALDMRTPGRIIKIRLGPYDSSGAASVIS